MRMTPPPTVLMSMMAMRTCSYRLLFLPAPSVWGARPSMLSRRVRSWTRQSLHSRRDPAHLRTIESTQTSKWPFIDVIDNRSFLLTGVIYWLNFSFCRLLEMLMVRKKLAISLAWSMRRSSRTSPGSLICRRLLTPTKLSTAYVGVPLTLSRTARASRCSCARAPAGSGSTRFASERPTSRFKTTKRETSLTFAHSANHQMKQVSKSKIKQTNKLTSYIQICKNHTSSLNLIIDSAKWIVYPAQNRPNSLTPGKNNPLNLVTNCSLSPL